MLREDVLFIERAEMVLADLRESYLKEEVKSKESESTKPDKLHLEILSCETIIEECKLEIQNSTLDEILSHLERVYHTNLREDEANALLKLEEILSSFLSNRQQDFPADEKVLAHFREDMALVLAIEDKLKLRLNSLKNERTWLFFKQTPLISKYEDLCKEFQSVAREILARFNRASEILSHHIIEDFHYLYLYFAYVIHYFTHTQNQLLLVEIASALDRFIDIMQPLLKSTTLKNKNLRNFYVIYEFKVLKELIIQHYE